jgi:hypothetical protein
MSTETIVHFLPAGTRPAPKTGPTVTRPEAMPLEDFRALLGTRTIYIFSVNLEGIGFTRRLSRLGFEVGGFIDSREFPDAHRQGKPVIHPDRFFAGNPEEVFVIITAKHRETRRRAIGLCETFGLQRNVSYLTSTTLCDYLPTIEIAGSCNLRCISCNMGLPGANKYGGLMSAATYRQVLEKMVTEIPFLNSVYLYLWGEPLINPNLPEIIRITREFGVASEISSNLVDGRRLEAFVKARPDVLVAPCSGIGDNFALTRTGGDWESYRENLYKLRSYLDKYSQETTVRITYHLYKHNLEEDYTAVETLARELGFQFLPVLAQIFPERVLRHVIDGDPIGSMPFCVETGVMARRRRRTGEAADA